MNRLKFLSLAIVLALTANNCAHAAEPLAECEVLARVNSEAILACEVAWEAELMLQERLARLPAEVRAQAPPAELKKAKKQIMQQLVLSRLDMAIFYTDFRSSVPQANIAEIHKSLSGAFVKQELPRLMKMTETESLPELEERLIAVGTSLTERKEDFFHRMIARSWLTETVKYNKEVTHDQMLEYYHEHQADYAFPTRAKWEELMVRFDKHPSMGDAYKAMALLGNQVHQAAAAAPTGTLAFAQVAKNQSDGYTADDGGVHDWTTEGSLAVEAIDKQIFSLQVGQMSPILEGPQGFHIVRVIERQQAGHTSFAKVQKKIATTVRNKRFDKAVLKRVTELKRKAHIWTIYTGDVDTSRVAATAENTRR